MDIDSFDRQLLAILRVDARQTGDQLADQVGLSPAACLRRVQRLRKIGAIEREVAIVSPEIDGPSVKILVFLQTSRGGADRIARLRAEFRSRPEVERVYHVTGEADLVLVLRCTSMEAYAAFTEAHFYRDDINRFDSMVVLRDYSPELG